MFSKLNSGPTNKSPEMACLILFISKQISSFPELQNLATEKKRKMKGERKERGRKERRGSGGG